MLEKAVETYLKDKLDQLRISAYKFVSPGHPNVPDRICFVPEGSMFLVETKKPGEILRRAQVREIRRLKKLKQKVFVIDTKEGVDELVSYCLKTYVPYYGLAIDA